MKPPTLCQVLREFGNDESCREYLEALRWPERVTCPRCESPKISRVYNRKVFDCDSCRYQFSVLAGTVFQDTKLPLATWFATTYLMCESRKGISANQVSRVIGGSYKTAWYLCHRIRAAMKEAQTIPLGGILQIGETYVGGKQHGKGTRGRSLKSKEVVIGIKQRGGELRFFHVSDVKSGTLAKYIKEKVSEDVDVIMTDDFGAYPPALTKAGVLCEHKAINYSGRVYVEGDITTNGIESAFSLLMRGIIRSWHKISAKHLAAYLNEMTFRFNNRDNPYLFRDTMKKLIEAPVLEYKKLTAA